MPTTSIPSTSNLSSNSRPTLPTEIVEDILAQDSLSKVDLARCCLVSRQFLHPARQSLYATLNFACYRDVNRWPVVYAFIEPSLHLVRTLRHSSTICSLVVAVSCDTITSASSGLTDREEITEILKESLDILPRVHQLHLLGPAYNALWKYVVSQPSRWTELEVSMNIVEAFRDNASFTKLKKLRCLFISGNNQSKPLYLPPQLTHLSFSFIDTYRMSIPNAASSSLEYLRLRTNDLLNFPDVSRLPRLQRLELRQDATEPPHIAELAGIVSRCQHLTSLLFSFSSPPSSDLHILFQHLPKSIVRLDFPHAVPLESLKILLDDESLDSSLGTIGFSKEGSEEEKDMESFTRLCASKGVEIEYISQTYSLLDM